MTDAAASRAVLVTGASRGIGAAVARAFAASGERVALHYGSRRRQAQEVAVSLPGSGHVVVGADLADPDAVRAMVDQAAAALGSIDVLVNNAGVIEPHPIMETSYADWQRAWARTLGVNLVGAANVTWCAALGPAGISVTVVAPGFTDTDMAAEELAGEQGRARRAESPLGRVATVQDIAAAVLFLASPQAELASGTVLDVNGASHLRM